MKKTVLTAVCSAFLAVSLCIGANAAFEKTAEYKNQFTDVAESSWYAKEVKSAFELGFMNGKSESTFVPDGTMTVAEGITMASRVNAIYNSKTIAEKKGEKWYDMYVDYAKQNGIIDDTTFNSFDRNIRRAEMAELFAAALPVEYFAAKNEVSAIPDVNSDEPYADTLLMLYKAGVVMGSDEYGNFHPNSSIKRSEAAAIVNRTAIPENRLEKTLTAAVEEKEAYYLIDDTALLRSTRGKLSLSSSWNYENRFDEAMNSEGLTTNALNDQFTDGYVAINRNIDMPESGTLTLGANVTLTGVNGARVYLANSKGEPKMEIYIKGGTYRTKSASEADTGVKAENGTHYLRVEMNLDTKKAVLSVNGAKAGEFDLADMSDVTRIFFSTSDEDKLVFTPNAVQMYANYAVNETFATGNFPYDWTGDAKVITINNSRRDNKTLELTAKQTASKTFSKVTDKSVFEAYVYVPEGAANVTLSNGDAAVVTVNMADGKLTAGDIAKDYFKGQWQIIHIETDAAKKTAAFYLNGKYIKNVPFNADGYDKVTFASDSGKAYVDDVKVYNTYDYADYVPEPVPATSDDYILIMSVCSLWREGTHSGWDFVSPYDECSPMMGYYDEGIPETSDWEIKYMAEHGIDAMEYCWYAENGTGYSTPQRTPGLVWALHDGYFYADYSDMVDFYILWENQNFNSAKMTLEQFKSYLWEYWVQMYFTDSRYLVINNKPVLNIYQFETMKKTFGSLDVTKKVINFMREDIKKYGFDDMIILFAQDASSNKDALNQINAVGADGVVAYAYDSSSYDPDVLERKVKASLENTKSFKNLAYIPTVATGRNIMGWEDARTPLSSVEQHKKVMDIYKEALKSQNKGTEWQDKMIYFSTWNEFGEGHWLAPSGLNGFGYADVWREAFTNGAAHDDAAPTINQQNRISHLYNDNRTPIRAWLLEDSSATEAKSTTSVKTWKFDVPESTRSWTYSNIKNFASKNGVLYMDCTTNDPMFRTPTKQNIDASTVDVIRISMKSSVASTFTVHFITTLDQTYNAAKGVSTSVSSGDEFKDVFVKVSENDLWTGTIDTIRFDPIAAEGTVEIEEIELLSYEKVKPALTIDGIVLDIRESYLTREDKELYVALNPDTGIFTANNFYYEWNRFLGRLYIKTGTDTDFVFTVGSDKALVNGAEKKLAKPFYTYDHLPVVPMLFIYDNANIKYTYKDGGAIVSVRGVDFSKIKEERVFGKFDFNLYGDMEGWEANNVISSVADGVLNLVAKPQTSSSTGYDPGIILKNLTINAEAVESIVIRMKYEFLANNIPEVHKGTTIYFGTSANSNLSEKQTLHCQLDDAVVDTDGYYLFTFNPEESKLWTGVINLIRFDMTNNNGIYDIDYVYINAKEGMDILGKVQAAGRPTIEENNPIPADAKPVYSIEFDKATDRELVSFGYANGSVDTEKSVLNMKTDSGKNDPQLYIKVAEAINDASKFDTMVILAKLPENLDAESTFFYMTGDMAAYSSKSKASASYRKMPVDKNGYSLVVMDVSKNSDWKGAITGIRFDPADIEDDYIIDSIKFYKLGGTSATTPATPSAPAANSSKPATTTTPNTNKLVNPIPADATPVAVFKFESEADCKKFAYHHSKGVFDADNKTVVQTSNAGTFDPQIQLEVVPTEIDDASKFNTMVVRAKLPNVPTAQATFFFKVDDMPAYSAEYRSNVSYEKLGVDEEGYTLLVFDLRNNDKWSGKVTGIRLDPAEMEDVYVIESISFYKL